MGDHLIHGVLCYLPTHIHKLNKMETKIAIIIKPAIIKQMVLEEYRKVFEILNNENKRRNNRT
ncbi:MAG: hypothetical protein ACTSW3_06175 [Promethearchaeota archaeon]